MEVPIVEYGLAFPPSWCPFWSQLNDQIVYFTYGHVAINRVKKDSYDTYVVVQSSCIQYVERRRTLSSCTRKLLRPCRKLLRGTWRHARASRFECPYQILQGYDSRIGKSTFVSHFCNIVTGFACQQTSHWTHTSFADHHTYVRATVPGQSRN